MDYSEKTENFHKHFHLFFNIIITYEILIKYTFPFLFQDEWYSLKLVSAVAV